MPKGGLRIDILGTSFTIAADEPAVYLESLLAKYSSAVESARRATGLIDPLKLSIVAGILLSDELEQCKKNPKNPLKSNSSGTDDKNAEAERLTLDLIARIDEALGLTKN
jgi:cell division protein ZapA (FtsZ GTPase activity inhibitor)